MLPFILRENRININGMKKSNNIYEITLHLDLHTIRVVNDKMKEILGNRHECTLI